jgi:competence protein ComEC
MEVLNRMKNTKKRIGIASLLSLMFLFTGVGCSGASKTVSNTVTTTKESTKETSKETVAAAKDTTTKETEKTNTASGQLKLHFIDVGQADSILIESGDKSMLIDAGNNPDGDDVVNYIKGLGIKKLDVVVGTHAHEDHIGGMDTVIKSFDIGQIIMPKAGNTTKTFEDVLTAIAAKGLKITSPVPGSEIKLNSATAKIVAPNGSDYKDLNDSSVAIKLTFGENSFMLMGDAEAVSEKEILAKGFDIKADLIKVGHHGSSSSTTQEFLNAVNPKYAVISVAKGNDYEHPHKPTMDKLKAKGIKVYRTDELGTIVATSDGKSITFNTKEGSYNYAGLGTSASSGSNSSSSSTAAKSTAPASAPTSAPAPAVTKDSSDDRIAYYVPNGKSYHFNKSCSTLARSKTILSGKLSDVIALGKDDPCDKCAK